MTRLILIPLAILAVGSVYLYRKFPIFVQYQNKDTVEVIEDIVYQAGSTNPKHQLDVYLPKDKKDFPIVHFVHGGYWVSGDKNYFAFGTGLYKNIGRTLAANGVGVVIQNYRLADDTIKITDQTTDIVNGIKWTVDNLGAYGGNTQQIYLMGHSAGGHLVSLVGFNPEYLKTESGKPLPLAGIITLSPLWDITGLKEASREEFNREVTYTVFGEDFSVYPNFSPATYLQEPLPNLLTILAEDDYPFIKKHVPEILQKFTSAPDAIIMPGFDHIRLVTEFGVANDRMTPFILNFIYQRTP